MRAPDLLAATAWVQVLGRRVPVRSALRAWGGDERGAEPGGTTVGTSRPTTRPRLMATMSGEVIPTAGPLNRTSTLTAAPVRTRAGARKVTADVGSGQAHENSDAAAERPSAGMPWLAAPAADVRAAALAGCAWPRDADFSDAAGFAAWMSHPTPATSATTDAAAPTFTGSVARSHPRDRRVMADDRPAAENVCENVCGDRAGDDWTGDDGTTGESVTDGSGPVAPAAGAWSAGADGFAARR